MALFKFVNNHEVLNINYQLDKKGMIIAELFKNQK